jgi:aldose 1-epimerase
MALPPFCGPSMLLTEPAFPELRLHAWRLALRPDLGGCVAGLWWHGRPVLRSTEPAALAEARRAASYPLVPYSNRIAEGRLPWQGRVHRLRLNVAGSPHPMHGVGFQRAWTVAHRTADTVELVLSHRPDEDWPFAFEARQRIVLSPRGVRFELSATHRGPDTAPMGLGWHPFFLKRPGSRLRAAVDGRWEMDERKLPSEHRLCAALDAAVDALDLDHCHTGWRGEAFLHDQSFDLRLSASTRHLVVFTPPSRPDYAVEPVSHANNAFHRDDPLAHGLVALADGHTASAWMQIDLLDARP